MAFNWCLIVKMVGFSELVNLQCSLGWLHHQWVILCWLLIKEGDRSVLGVSKSCTSSCRIERMITPDWRYEELQ